jgi:acyl-coenzyme A synthetase/AMP-(fatty) acid ligase
MDFCFTTGDKPTSRGTPQAGRTRVIAFDPAWVEPPPADRSVPEVALHQDDAAIYGIFPTSGTTGSPKLVTLSVDTVKRRIASRGRGIPLPADVRQICMIGLGTQFGFGSVLRVLSSGGTAVLQAPEATTQQLVADIRRHRVNHMVMSPMTLERLALAVPEGEGPLPSLESIEVSGSVIPAALYELARRRVCANIISSYGSTENGHVASAPMSALVDKPGAVGYLHPGIEVEAVDANGQPLPPGQEGMLRVRTGHAASGYLDNVAAADSVFRDGWVYPGDTGSVAADGLLTITGRSSELINSGGNKVNPQRIEDVLLAFPGVREAAAFGVPDAVGLTRVWAAMVVDRPVDPVALHAHCVKRLGATSPQRVMKMDALPRTETGKVSRAELARIALAKHGAKVSADLAATAARPASR